MNGLRASGKLLRAALHVVRGFVIIRWHFPKLQAAEREGHVQRWAAQMLTVLGIELVRRGPPLATGPVLLVANHVSWLDILVMHASGYCRFVSKAGVKDWPFIGIMASEAGTVFIERESRRDAHRVLHHMVERLHAGDVLAVFPEGTTGDGLTLKPFHANLIQAAITAEVPVQPMALRFVDGATGQTSLAPSFVGDETLLGSVWQTVLARQLQAEVSVGHAEPAQGRDRRTWAGDLRERIDALRSS